MKKKKPNWEYISGILTPILILIIFVTILLSLWWAGDRMFKKDEFTIIANNNIFCKEHGWHGLDPTGTFCYKIIRHDGTIEISSNKEQTKEPPPILPNLFVNGKKITETPYKTEKGDVVIMYIEDMKRL